MDARSVCGTWACGRLTPKAILRGGKIGGLRRRSSSGSSWYWNCSVLVIHVLNIDGDKMKLTCLVVNTLFARRGSKLKSRVLPTVHIVIA